MELQGEDGSIVELSETLKKELGRGPGIAALDRSVSRRQVRLQVQRIGGHFVVIDVVGPNPICVIHATGGDVEVEVVKSGSQSSLNIGDKFSLSIQAPVFYTLSANRSVHESTDRGKLVEDDQQGIERDEEEGIAEAVARWQRRKQERLQSDQRRSSTDEAEAQQAQDVSQQELVYSQAVSHEVNEPDQTGKALTSEADTDVAKKFGFIVEGSEFERYGRKGLDTSKWNWRIGRQSNNEDDDVEERRGLSPNPKQKAKSRDEEDDDWRGDSEGEKERLSARKRPSLRKKDVQTRSHNSATISDTRKNLRKKRKLDSTSCLQNASVEEGKTKLSRQATPSTSTKKSSTAATDEDEEEEEDDDGEDLDGFLVDDVDEEDEEVADEEDEWTDEDEEVEEEGEFDEDPSGARAPGRYGKDKGDGGDNKPLCKYGNKCFRKNKDHLAEFRH